MYIANEGPSSGTESNTIRIGTQGTGESQQDVTFIAGIYGATSSGGVSVYINSTADSERRLRLSALRSKSATWVTPPTH